jgi:hypothetical protein
MNAMVRDAINAYDDRNRYELERILNKHLSRVETLFEAIAHGTPEHRAWLQQAINDHFAGKPVTLEEK